MSQGLETRRADPSFVGPFGETHLRDQLGRVLNALTDAGQPDNEVFLQLIEVMTAVDRTYTPEDLENYALKPLYSFAGLGVVIGPTKREIAAVPADKRSQYILQERLHFEPVIETPQGKTKAEIRVMYIWLKQLLPVMTIVRMGRGLQMGVDHNRDLEWVGSSAGLY